MVEGGAAYFPASKRPTKYLSPGIVLRIAILDKRLFLKQKKFAWTRWALAASNRITISAAEREERCYSASSPAHGRHKTPAPPFGSMGARSMTKKEKRSLGPKAGTRKDFFSWVNSGSNAFVCCDGSKSSREKKQRLGIGDLFFKTNQLTTLVATSSSLQSKISYACSFSPQKGGIKLVWAFNIHSLVAISRPRF